MNSIVKKSEVVDEFDTGEQAPTPLVKFTNESTFVCNDEQLKPDTKWIGVSVEREVHKWVNGLPTERRYLEPGEPWPDFDSLNAQVPQSEWIEGPDGKLRGPIQGQYR